MFSPISLNSAIFVSVLLASRLKNTIHTFTMVITAFAFFAGAPEFTQFLRDHYPSLAVLFNVLITIFVSLLYVFINKAVFALIVLLFICIQLILPIIHVNMQKLKNTIHGPWDEA